jgi:carbamoyl-phosphate synthase small subunit
MIYQPPSIRPRSAALALEDGRIFRGAVAGKPGLALGEAVFCTAMTGYQEVLTDPSYAGQIVVMTFPLIGNTGVNTPDHESETPRAAGFIARRFSRTTSNYRAEESLHDFLGRHGLPAADEFDTRAITRHLRTRGAMRAALVTDARATLPDSALVELARSGPSLLGVDLASQVARPAPTRAFADGRLVPLTAGDPFAGGDGPRVAVVDFGMKGGIARLLAASGARVVVVPGTWPVSEVCALAPDGVVLSNGPGDPEAVVPGIDLAKALLGRMPILGICLGHQLLGLALELGIEKLHFGHRGANHPVLDVVTGRVLITSQNHGFAVTATGPAADEIQITHRSLFDGTLEGFAHSALRLRAVQFHPEASPGPHDAAVICTDFVASLTPALKPAAATRTSTPDAPCPVAAI